MLTINNIKSGAYIIHQGDPYLVVKHDFVKMGRGQGVMRATIKNLKTGKIIEHSFRGQEKVQEADISRAKANYLYKEGDNYYFMDSESYDQFFVTDEQLGDMSKFLFENLEVEVLKFNNEAINIELPNKINLEVKQAPPGIRGDTAQGSVTKKVTLENGLAIDTPLFIKQGDTVEINTETGKYVGKVSK